jgi:hypothetical protein
MAKLVGDLLFWLLYKVNYVFIKNGFSSATRFFPPG